MDSINRIRKLVSSWYIRYLTATELYMVEPWEKIFIHILFGLFFAIFWYFNSSIIVNGISQLRFPSNVEEMKSLN
ncbi:uncharacterized protein LOC133319729 [Danaus plexippus]|uniref:uncharacterized protein LOC133319729 n=1 Tax=Danaus plexippus TaxID=13037 RepID=UPI002AB1ED53|nr:uncharacterized protein LOC133319729 [Danaus plexippus]